MIKIAALVLSILGAALMATAQGRSWVIQLEEPTGIERRDNEVVRFATRFAAGQARAELLRVLDEESREVPIQVVVGDAHADGSLASAEILFPATLIPGRQPNSRFGIIINLGKDNTTPAIVEASAARRTSIGCSTSSKRHLM